MVHFWPEFRWTNGHGCTQRRHFDVNCFGVGYAIKQSNVQQYRRLHSSNRLDSPRIEGPMSSQAKIVHLIPRGVLDNSYHGSFKDVVSRVKLFEHATDGYRQVVVDGDDPGSLASEWGDWADSAFLIEYSYYPKITRALRTRFPKAFIAVRSHNIEPLQHLHNYGWWSSRGPAWVGYGMARLFWGDVVVKRYADVIYSISDWERVKYWSRIPGKATQEWLPYYCPDHLVGVKQSSSAERTRIVCMPTSVKGRKSLDLVRRFISFAELAKEQGAPYEFLITGNLESWPPPRSEAVRYTGMIDDLGPFFRTVKAVCILSDLGYGFKTTIADALANGASVIVHKRLKQRFFSMLGDTLISLEADSPKSVQDALRQLQEQRLLQSNPHDEFRQRSHAILSRDFSLGSVV